MERRKFLASSLAASALALGNSESPLQAAQAPDSSAGHEYYHLRRYSLTAGTQPKLAEAYFRDALVPALNRLGITPVGVFSVYIGPDTPAMYVLMPGKSLQTLVTVEYALAKDADYLKTGAPFLEAPAAARSFNRIESSLFQAFEGTHLTVPAAAATHSPRFFELRTYENPSDRDHKAKVEMMTFHERAVFDKAGMAQVFYGDPLIGPKIPNVTYMLAFDSLADREAKWQVFMNLPEWKSLSTQPQYAFESIVANINNTILTPTAYSQI